MRKLEELTTDEIVALSDDDVERYIDLACAESGVPLLPPMPMPPDKPDAEPDGVVYAVGGIRFFEREDAQRVVDIANDLRRADEAYAPGAGWRHKIVTAKDDPETVETVKVWTPTGWDRNRNAIQKYDDAHATYDAENKEYQAAVKARGEASEWVRRTVSGAYAEHMRRQRLERDYARYLDIADGNEVVAARFLREAHSDAEEVLPHLYRAEDDARGKADAA